MPAPIKLTYSTDNNAWLVDPGAIEAYVMAKDNDAENDGTPVNYGNVEPGTLFARSISTGLVRPGGLYSVIPGSYSGNVMTAGTGTAAFRVGDKVRIWERDAVGDAASLNDAGGTARSITTIAAGDITIDGASVTIDGATKVVIMALDGFDFKPAGILMPPGVDTLVASDASGQVHSDRTVQLMVGGTIRPASLPYTSAEIEFQLQQQLNYDLLKNS